MTTSGEGSVTHTFYFETVLFYDEKVKCNRSKLLQQISNIPTFLGPYSINEISCVDGIDTLYNLSVSFVCIP